MCAHLAKLPSIQVPKRGREESGSLKTNNLSKRSVCVRGKVSRQKGQQWAGAQGWDGAWMVGAACRKLAMRAGRLDILAAQAQFVAPQVVVE